MKRGPKQLFSTGFKLAVKTVFSVRAILYSFPKQRATATVLLLSFLLAFIPGLIPNLGLEKAGAAGMVSFGGSTTSFTDNGTNVVINKPSVTVSGDTLVAVVSTQGQNPTITPPTGWTSFKEIVNGTTNFAMEAFWKQAGGSEPSSYTFGTGGSSTRWAGGISVYKGVGLNSGNPIDVNGTASTTTHVAPSITTTTANSRVVSVYGLDHDAPQTYTPPTGTKERFDVSSQRVGVGNTDTAVMMADIIQYSAAASGTKTATPTAASNAASFQFALKPDGVVRMLLFWDSVSAAPTGWSIVDDYDGSYPRADDASVFGSTGGTASHTPTISSTSINENDPDLRVRQNGSSAATGANGHAHTPLPTETIGSASNEPAYRTIRLMRYDGGVPNVIPNGALALFDDSPNTVPTNWTTESDPTDGYYQRMIKLDAGSPANGGSDTHQHSVSWSGGLPAASTGADGVVCVLCGSGNQAATSNHTHTLSSTNTTSITQRPAFFAPRLLKAGADTATISIGITAMFDGDPGGGWVIRSKSSGTGQETQYYQKMLRPSDAFGTGTTCTPSVSPTWGCDTHTHAAHNNTSGIASAGVNATNLGANIAPIDHTHTITTNFNSANNLPPYFSIVIAEKVNFILSNYYWYANNNSVTPTDKWGNPDLAQHTAIVTLPITAADPPDLARDLRLRVQVLINGNDLAANVVAFKLQYNATRSSSCTTINGSWQDVGASSATDKAWRYTTSTSVTASDSTTLAAFPGGRVDFTPVSTIPQHYIRGTSPGNNPNSATIGDYIEYDFHISNYAAAAATQYSFRIIENTGTLLSQYDYCPTLTTRPRTENQLRHGNFFNPDPAGDGSGSLENGFSWVD